MNYKSIQIKLKTEGYDPFIDFIKGVCILFVVLNHCVPSNLSNDILFYLWGTPAVPLFFILQTFHTYKKGTDNIHFSFTKMWNRILKPFLLIQLIIIFIKLLQLSFSSDFNIIGFVEETLLWGGVGPGSYFPWVYFEISLLLPVFSFIFNCLNNKWLFVFFIFISEFVEILGSLFSFPFRLYRLSFLPFLFTIYIGYLLAKKGIIMNFYAFVLSVISILLTILVVRQCVNFYPFVYDHVYTTHHWFSYVYIYYLFVFLLFVFYKIDSFNLLKQFIKKMGQYSYDIFLFQMFYFSVLHNVVVKMASYLFDNYYFISVLSILLAVMVCVVPVVYVKQAINSGQ